MMPGLKAPDFDAYGLLRATHSHNPTQYSHIRFFKNFFIYTSKYVWYTTIPVNLIIVCKSLINLPAICLHTYYYNHRQFYLPSYKIKKSSTFLEFPIADKSYSLLRYWRNLSFLYFRPTVAEVLYPEGLLQFSEHSLCYS